jgi:pyrimidine operon attenuation protein/uracil phosphoribosyltransferase
MIATHTKSRLMSGLEFARTLVRWTDKRVELVENTQRTSELVMVGMHRRGASASFPLAEKGPAS